MDYGLYVAAAGADTQSRRMEVLSNNLTNVDTPGFKEELAILQARHSRAIRDGKEPPGRGGINDLGSGVSMAETQTDFAAGQFKHTGYKWDAAIRGDGFFVVDDGERQLLTRAGNFQLDGDGNLLTQQGFRVLDAEGSPIVVNPNMYSQIHKDGWVEHSGGGQLLGLVKPESLGDLARVGNNTFNPLGPVTNVARNERTVEPGFLELSGVKPTESMMKLIETSRMYEANARMIQNHDQMTGSLVNRILTAQ
ncbi:MAG: flagellar hook-basal body protein [Planctomycetota bacterium]